MATRNDSLVTYPAEFVSNDYAYASVVSGYPATNPIGKSNTSTTMSRFNLKTGSSAVSYVYYKFDCSEIPQSATITSISCSVKAYISQTNSSRINTRQVQMFTGTTAKGSASTMSNSTTALNLSCGTWNRSELNDCRIRLYVKRGTSNTTTTYYMGLYGATLTINYSWNSVEYSITTNVTGGTIDPSNPSVEQGSSQTFKIKGTTGKEELATLTLDGTNILSQAQKVSISGGGMYTVSPTSASYTFEPSGNYYVSNNKGVASSCALCRVDFDLAVECTINVYVINYAEATYDFGLLSNIDQMLSTSASADSTYKWSGKNANSASEQLVTYTMSSGQHFISIKYFKDSYTNSNNDTLQFRIEIVPNEAVSDGQFYYEYTLENVTSTHTIVAIFGDAPQAVLYFKDNGSWKTCSQVFKKVNGSWVEQTDLENLFNTNTNYVKG